VSCEARKYTLLTEFIVLRNLNTVTTVLWLVKNVASQFTDDCVGQLWSFYWSQKYFLLILMTGQIILSELLFRCPTQSGCVSRGLHHGQSCWVGSRFARRISVSNCCLRNWWFDTDPNTPSWLLFAALIQRDGSGDNDNNNCAVYADSCRCVFCYCLLHKLCDVLLVEWLRVG
jgi:hypothetical protein